MAYGWLACQTDNLWFLPLAYIRTVRLSKKLSMYTTSCTIGLLRGCADLLQDGIGQRQRQLAFARKHVVRSRTSQAIEIAQIGRSRQHAQGGIQLAREPDHLFGIDQISA